MPKLLVVEASPRGDLSISRNLSTLFIQAWKNSHPHGEIVERDLAKMHLPTLTLPWIGAIRTPAEKQTVEMHALLALSDELVDELLSADHIAISTPVYNYNVPADLKAYIDHVVRRGRTLGMAGEGLVHGKSCTVLLASGSVYTAGSPMEHRDFATAYLRLILGVIGITDLTVVAGGGTRAVEVGETPRADFLKAFEPAILSAATREHRG